MRPDQLQDFRVPSDPQLHPDGRRIVFTVTQMDFDGDRYVRRLWLWDGSGAGPITAGPDDGSPRISPDGAALAFTRKGSGAHSVPQIAIMALDGGEAEVVTNMPGGVREPAWSPDGQRIAFAADAPAEGEADLSDEEKARRPRRITKFPYRVDDVGWVADRNIHLLDPASRTSSQLTDGRFVDDSIAWHPDGSEIAFLSARHDGAGLDAGNQVWTVAAGGGEPTARTDVGTWSLPSYDRSGSLHAVGIADRWAMPDVHPLVRIAGDGAPVPLAPDLDRNIVFYSAAMAPSAPQWLDDGSAIVPVEDRGAVRIDRIAADGGHETLIEGRRVVTGVSPHPDGATMAFVASTVTNPGELWWWGDGGERQLTDLNGSFAGDAGLVEPKRFVIEHDGVAVEGWIYLPPGDTKVPVLLNIHGGPAAQYGWGFFDEFQVYVGDGYGVVATNPRGSGGYGRDHLVSIVDTWQQDEPPDMQDLLVAVDTAVATEPRLDPSRVGVMGGSYGGLATIRLLALDDRYRSAVAERGLYSFPSFSGTSDIGPWFSRNYLGRDLDWATAWRASPLARADAIATPTLVLHSEGDWRTPIEQGEQLFLALLANGVETEFVRFPATAGHNLSRSGLPVHRRERFEIILEWHGRYLD